MASKALKTTPEEFEAFKAECEHQVARLGLQDWDIRFEHKRLPKRECANFQYDCEAHSGIMILNTTKPDEHEDSRQTAKHECAHALITPLKELAESRFVTQREIDNAAEAIAMKLEKIL